MGSNAEYNQWLPPLDEIFQIFSGGFITARDHFVIDYDRDALLNRLSDFADSNISDVEIRRRYFAGKGSSRYPDGQQQQEAGSFLRREGEFVVSSRSSEEYS